VGAAGAALDALLDFFAELFELFQFAHGNLGIQKSEFRIQEKTSQTFWVLTPGF
jgi:hypothetical protein